MTFTKLLMTCVIDPSLPMCPQAPRSQTPVLERTMERNSVLHGGGVCGWDRSGKPSMQSLNGKRSLCAKREFRGPSQGVTHWSFVTEGGRV